MSSEIKDLSTFEKALIRSMLKQSKSIYDIALAIKRGRTPVRNYIKSLRRDRRAKKGINAYVKKDNEIKPILKTAGIDLPNSGTIDIETGTWKDATHKEAKMVFSTTVLCVSYYDTKVGKHTFKTIKEAITFIFEKTTVKTIFAHNFRGFESLYLIEDINKLCDNITLRTQGKNANPFLFGCKVGKRYLTFQDSYSIIPYPLANITSEKGFDTATKKGELEKGKDAPYYSIAEIEEYNRSDCIGLYEALVIMGKEIMEAFGLPLKNTTSSLGFSIFKKHYLPDKIVIDNAINKILRKAYHGGAVQILGIPHPNKDVLIVEADINSSYPKAMLNKIPFPPYETIKHPDIKLIFEKEGFSYGKITYPKDVRFPILTSPSKNKKLIFPIGSFKGLFAHPSLRFAIKVQGAKFIPEYSIIGTPQTYLKAFAEDLYAMRQKAAGNNAKRYTYKILLNGMYGRWGISDEQTLWVINNMTEKEWLNSDATIDENFVPLKIKNPNSQAVVSVAAYITDYGRVNLWIYLYVLLETLPPENICYFDTDAIFYLPKKQPTKTEWEAINAHEQDKVWLDAWVSKNGVNLRTGLVCNDELGAMKLELVGKRSDIVTSKVYKVTRLDGTCLYRAKGFNLPETVNPANMETWWIALKEGKPIEMRGLLTFITSLHQQKTTNTTEMVRVKEEVTRQLRNAYDKREIVPLENHPLLLATTKPLEVNEQ